MKDGIFWFTFFPNKDRALSHHLEVGTFPSDFIFSSVQGPFLRADEEFGRSSEVVELFKIKVVNFTCVLFQVQDYGAYALGIDETPNSIDFWIFPFSRFLYSV